MESADVVSVLTPLPCVIDLKRHFPTGKAADWYVICARNATGDPSRAKAQKSFQWFGMSNSPQFRGILFQRASPSWGTLLLRPMTLNLILSLVAALCLCLFFFFWFRRREA